MPKFKPDLRGGTDIAALSGGVVAVSVSLFTGNGEYGPLNVVVSLTLMSVISGYVWRGFRRKAQSIAFAVAVGFALVPAFGFVLEAASSRDAVSFLLGSYRWDCALDRCGEDRKPESRVPQRDLAVLWFIAATYTFCVDRIAQHSWRTASEREYHK